MLISRKYTHALMQNKHGLWLNASIILMAGGNLKLASYLCKILFWHLPHPDEPNSKTKLTIKIKKEWWLSKTDKEMAEETYLTLREVRVVKKLAMSMGYIKTCIKRYNGLATTHVTLTRLFEKTLRACDKWVWENKGLSDINEAKSILERITNKLKEDKQSQEVSTECANQSIRYDKKRQSGMTKNDKAINSKRQTVKDSNNSFSKEKRSGDKSCSSCKDKPCNGESSLKTGLNKKPRKRLKKKKGILGAHKNQCNVLKDDVAKREKIILAYWNKLGGRLYTEKADDGPKLITKYFHLLFLDGAKNPYSQVLDEEDEKQDYLRLKKWTVKEIKQAIKYYVKTLKYSIEKDTFEKFVLSIPYYAQKKKAKVRSPLVECHMDSPQEVELSKSDKWLIMKLHELRPDEVISQKVFHNVCRFVKQLEQQDYVPWETAYNHLYDLHGLRVDVLGYAQKMANKVNWKVSYMSGETFESQFLEYATKNYVIKKLESRYLT